MGIVFRQSAKTSIIVLTGSVLGAVIIWLSTKYIEDKHQFGFIQNLTNNAVVISQVLLFGLNSTLAVYIHRFNEAQKKLLITICLAIPTLLFILFTVLYFSFRSWVIQHFQPDDIPYMQAYYGWLPVYVLLFIYQMMFEQYLGSQMKVAAPAFLREVVLRIVNITLLILYSLGIIDFHFFVVGTVLMYLITFIAFTFLASRTAVFGISFDLKLFSRDELKDIVYFSWYHFLLAAALIFMANMDILLLPFYDHKGFEAVAIYKPAVFIISFLQLPTKALIPPTIPVLAKAFADDNHTYAKDIFGRSSINILIPTVLLLVLIYCNLDNAISVIKNGYNEIKPIFMILSISMFINLATGMNDQVLSIAKYYKFNFYLSLFLIIILFVLIRLLVPAYGIYGAAWSTTITISIFNFAKFFFVWKKLDMQPFSINTVLVLVAALPALAVGYFFPHFFNPDHHIYIHSFIDAALRSTAICITYLLMLLWLRPSKDLQEYLATVKKNKRLF